MAASTTPIEFQCASCNQAYRVKPELAGKKIKCKCSHIMHIPTPTKPPAIDEQPSVLDLEELGLSDQPNAFTKQCPSCGNQLPSNAILCVNCGYNLNTGKITGSANPKAKPIKEKRIKERSETRGAGSNIDHPVLFTIAKILNWIIIVFIVIGLIGSLISGNIITGILNFALAAAAAGSVLKILADPPGTTGERIGGYFCNGLFLLIYAGLSIFFFAGSGDPLAFTQDMTPEELEIFRQIPVATFLKLVGTVFLVFSAGPLLNIVVIHLAGRE